MRDGGIDADHQVERLDQAGGVGEILQFPRDVANAPEESRVLGAMLHLQRNEIGVRAQQGRQRR